MRSHKWLVAAIAALLCLAAAGTAVAWSSDWGPFASSEEPSVTPSPTAPDSSDQPSADATPTTSAPMPSQSVTPTPVPDPSPEPAETSVPAPAPGPTPATVVITYASWAAETSAVEVGSYVTVVEDGGQCTLTLTRGTAEKSQAIDALSDVSTMSCGGFLIPGADLSTGTWSAVVTYASESFSGQSEPVEVTVP